MVNSKSFVPTKKLFHLLWLSQVFVPLIGQALSPQQALNQIEQLSPQAGVLLGEGEKTLLSQNEEKLYVSASTIKVPLVISAFNLLGDDFRFTTSFYRNKENDLLIRGGGDPLLISEEIALIATALKERGWSRFNRLHLDDSLYQHLSLAAIGDSTNPYDAPLASLGVNFNTMNLIRQTNGKLVSAEPQTPTLPLAQRMKDKIPCCNQPTRISLKGEDTRAYAAQLFEAIFSQNGISLLPGYRLAQWNKEWSLIYKHRNSRSLADISQALLLYSNNLIANSLLLQFMPDSANILAASLVVWQEDLNHMAIENFRLVEGSGLDRRNQFTPSSMFRLLTKFTPYIYLLPSDQQGAYYKTGSLKGISNSVGYIKKNDQLRPFVIFNDQGSYKPILAILKQVD